MPKAHDAFDVFTQFDHADNVSAAVKSAAELLGLRGVNGNKTDRRFRGR